MYEVMLDRVTAAGYEQYEISNFSRSGLESRHNSKYWRLDPVYGFGVSAHSFDGTDRYSNERDTAKYVERIETSGSAEVMREAIDLVSESAFLGLRMTSGIEVADLKRRFGVDLSEKYSLELEELIESDLIEWTSDRLRLTSKGMLYSNEVFRVFV
jgi:oxygen-independent coproporphyrinogen-3 oxidase